MSIRGLFGGGFLRSVRFSLNNFDMPTVEFSIEPRKLSHSLSRLEWRRSLTSEVWRFNKVLMAGSLVLCQRDLSLLLRLMCVFMKFGRSFLWSVGEKIEEFFCSSSVRHVVIYFIALLIWVLEEVFGGVRSIFSMAASKFSQLVILVG